MSPSGADLARLLLGGYRKMVDAASAELAAQGWGDVKPVHEFAVRAIAGGATGASELGRRTSVSKQAAAKTIAALVERNLVVSEPDPDDARRKRLRVTESGFAVMAAGEAVLDGVRTAWEKQIGASQLVDLEERLAALVGTDAIRVDAPGWIPDDPE